MDQSKRDQASFFLRRRWRIAFLSLLLILIGAGVLAHGAVAQEEGEESPRLGLLAERKLPDGRTLYSLDSAPRYDGSEASSPASIVWTGELFLPDEGTYQFAAEFRGRLLWKLGDQTLIDEFAEELVVRSASLTLNEGKTLPLRIEFTPSQGSTLRTFWSGPKFAPEPLSEMHLTPPIDAAGAPATLTIHTWPLYLRGETLLERHRCAACHDLGDAPAPVSDLAVLGRWLKPAWIEKRLRAAAPESHSAMPAMGLSDAEAAAFAAAISANTADASPKIPSLTPEQAANAETLLTTSGCLACHSWKDIGQDKSNIGGDLTQIGDKWTFAFFQKWLSDPQKVDPHAQMPRPALSDEEIAVLAALLAASQSPKDEAQNQPSPSNAAAIDVKSLAANRRCGACHVLPASLRTETPPRLPRPASFASACLAEPTDRHPGFAFTDEERRALETALRSHSAKAADIAFARPTRSPLEKQGCTQCHARGAEGGLRQKLLEIAAELPERFPRLTEMTPPPLNSVGDKLHDRALRDAILRTPKTKKQRPWLDVRMPLYTFSDAELKTLRDELLREDRVPESVGEILSSPLKKLPTEAELRSAGARLVTTDGFSCTSCHDIGVWKASPAKPAARGTDLAMCGQRLRKEWFLRWLRNPARIAPNMEMPSLQVPVKGVLGGDLDAQLLALWTVMNQPGFTPPSSAALRVLAGDPGGRQPIAYLTDVVIADGKSYIKPLLVALPNQVNFLWDMEENRLARFWTGEAARQYTRGKTWYWHAEGLSLLSLREGQPELLLVRNGKRHSPIVMGQFATEFDFLQVDAQQISFRHRLRYPFDNGETRVVSFTQTFRPLSTQSGDALVWGFSREIVAEGRLEGETIEFIEPREQTRTGGVRDAIVAVQVDAGRAIYHYLTTEPPPAALQQLASPLSEAGEADRRLVPGFIARRLPLPIEIMPTAIAWRPDGAMGVASLRGRIWQAKDLDGDGLEESAQPFTEEFAAPYGLAGRVDGYDLLAKGGLYRAIDRNGDGVAEEVRLLASGWGHTDDYHDWAVGLPSDGRGGYYVALPCQQDDRSPAAARLRGKLLRLSPREPTSDDPRAFAVEAISSGHRFPMGLARRSSDGALFVTDNQGNYNPFNELNHVAEGKFFGFINQLEKRTGFTPPPLDPPAINIPHPWTRSVNGVCFLESPAGHSFGPFEGHLIGCEYDTRRLVRMTLQKIGDQFQGAVYPLSREAAPDSLSFLGPVSCAVSPRGELYIGSMKDSGWGAGNNVGEVIQLKFDPASLPAGIAEVEAVGPDSLAIQLHGDIAAAAGDASNYRIESYTRVSTPAYGGPDQHRRRETIEKVEFDAAQRRATLKLAPLRPGFVYEIHVDRKLAQRGDFFPAEAHFTFHAAP